MTRATLTPENKKRIERVKLALKHDPDVGAQDLRAMLGLCEKYFYSVLLLDGGLREMRDNARKAKPVKAVDSGAYKCRYYVAKSRCECGQAIESGQYCPEHYARVNTPNGGGMVGLRGASSSLGGLL